MLNVLISGCSFTQDSLWPATLFPAAEIKNLARTGSSNGYISDSIINAIDIDNPPDYVFILWTGLNKFDIQLPVSAPTTALAQRWKYVGCVSNTYYFFDGGDKINSTLVESYNTIKDCSWPKVKNLVDFWQLPAAIQQESLDRKLLGDFDSADLMSRLKQSFVLHRIYNDSKFYNDISLRAIANCCAFLERYGIDYNFDFCFDIFSSHTDGFLFQGMIDKSNPYFGKINWSKYCRLPPYEFALKNNLISQDDFHPSPESMNLWTQQIKRIIKNSDVTST